MTISGFGRLGNGIKEPSDVLQKAFVPFVKIDECRERYQARRIAVNLEKQFCAGGNNITDTCNGDSGLLRNNQSFIVVNFFLILNFPRRSNYKCGYQRKINGLWNCCWRCRL